MPEEIEINPHEDTERVHENAHGHSGGGWIRWVPLSTALLAAVAAVAALQSGAFVNEALLIQSKGVQFQSQASDQWAFYQAKSIKARTSTQTADLLPPGSPLVQKYRSESKRYESETGEIKEKATQLEEKRDQQGEIAGHLMHRHHQFAYAVTCLQVAIALSAITAISKKKPMWIGSLTLGVVGIALMVIGLRG